MNHHPSQAHHRWECSLKHSHVRALCWTAVGWVIGVIIIGIVIGQRQDGILSEAMVIALASGAIAGISMLPGLLAPISKSNQVRSQAETISLWRRISAGLMAGSLIRMVGTVALFLTCRYHMASTIEMIVAMTIGWYVLLTSIEVFVLARGIPDDAETSERFATPTPVKV